MKNQDDPFLGVDYFMLGISKDEVVIKNTRIIRKKLENFLNPVYAKKFHERIDVSISGYDFDERELCEIPEVREYITLVDKDFPYWFFYLSKFSSSLQFVTFSLCDHIKLADGLLHLVENEKLKSFFRRHFAAMNEICDLVKFSQNEKNSLMGRVNKYYYDRP